MITRLHWISAVATALSFAAAADAAEPIFVQIPALFDPRAPVNDAVRRECGLDGLLGNDVFEQVKATFPDSTALQKPAGTEREKVLRVTILSVSAQGGGLWSGGKSITVRADLVQSGKIIATTVKERGSRGGAFGQFRGTCGILERVIVTTPYSAVLRGKRPMRLQGAREQSSSCSVDPDAICPYDPQPQTRALEYHSLWCPGQVRVGSGR